MNVGDDSSRGFGCRRWGCTAGVVLILGLSALVWWGVQTRLRLRITSVPDGAEVQIGPSSATYTTPADVSRSFAPIQNWEWFYLNATSGPLETRGRMMGWDAGFKGGFSVFVNKIESLDGAAWVNRLLPGPQQISVHFSVPGKYAFAHQFRDSNQFIQDGKLLEGNDRSGVQFLAAGANKIETKLWSAEIDSAEGYCVQCIEWGGSVAERLKVSFEPGQIRSGSLVLDGTEIPIEDYDQEAWSIASTCRLRIEGNDGSKCDVSIKFERPEYPSFSLRVTSSQ